MENFSEKELMSSLEKAGLEKDSLKNYSALLTHLRANKLILEKWGPLGQPNPEIIKIAGRLTKENLAALSPIMSTKGLESARLFPKGIINPEIFDIQLEFNSKLIVK